MPITEFAAILQLYDYKSAHGHERAQNREAEIGASWDQAIIMNEIEEIFGNLLEIQLRLDRLGLSIAAIHINNALEELSPDDDRIPRIF